ncbi:MAG: hypothetical protein U5Q44_09580 [Dehalococcoidia bacterium]|nr:hypothetical protein [Dehalococcoidia bacterium]
MDDHALRVLEFHRVLELVSAECAFSLGRERVAALRPETDFATVTDLQSTTGEMALLYQMGIDVPFGGARDIRPTLRSAAIGHLLEPQSLLEAAHTLKAAVRARRTIERASDRVPRLESIAAHIGDFFTFTDAVDESISDRGEVLDSASDALATARRELRQAQVRLDQRAQSAMQDAIRRGIVQESLLTERNGRKVIPVRAEMRGQVSGIVHDVSSSGATVFIEPMGVVDAGNEVRELQLAEEREVRRVLQHLTDELGAFEHDANIALDTLARLDELHAKVLFGRRVKAALPPAGSTEPAGSASRVPPASSGGAIRCSPAMWSPSTWNSAANTRASSSPVRTRAARPLRSRRSASSRSWPSPEYQSPVARTAPSSSGRPSTPTSATSSPGRTIATAHFLLAHAQYHRHPRTRGPGYPGPARRARRWHRPHRGRRARPRGPGDAP